MAVDLSYNEGKCPHCGRIHKRKKPIDYAICDCYLYCPNGHKMEPYTHPVSPSTYQPIESDVAWGDTKRPMFIRYWCPICRYYSALPPQEVMLL